MFTPNSNLYSICIITASQFPSHDACFSVTKAIMPSVYWNKVPRQCVQFTSGLLSRRRLETTCEPVKVNSAEIPDVDRGTGLYVNKKSDFMEEGLSWETQLVKKLFAAYRINISLPCSQQPYTGPCLKLVETDSLHISKIHYLLIHDKVLLIKSWMNFSSHSSWFHHPNYIFVREQIMKFLIM
jgi:hypothetical protein